MDFEKRRFTRVPFRVRVEMGVNNRTYTAPEIEDLSVGGCRVPVEADVNEGDPCRIEIFLSGANSELSVKVKGRIEEEIEKHPGVK